MNVAIIGINGKMGRILMDEVSSFPDIEIIGGVDAARRGDLPFPFYTSPEHLIVRPDCIIDFSRPAALTGVLAYAVKNLVPVVICTTGHDAEQIKQTEAAAKKIPVLKSGNMSVGINVILDLIRRAAEQLPGFDIEITETHHNEKADAPSGTALMLLDAAKSGVNEKRRAVYGRSLYDGKRGTDEIGIHSLRGGTVPGEHEISFFGADEIVTISHTALSRRIFAVGAYRAARWIVGKAAGLYSMRDVIK